ncbi:glycoside hydrolase family 10 protein [Anaerosporobacter faecicola]|uniref:glycoside hydrolase family 10 protein n=1 Tax=Anaerosporobacter faecicola TaxID=2718714 RepID=UPI0014398B9E|nr:family 10 glycosylhydrolase [Anaerosporobacter faecicola]
MRKKFQYNRILLGFVILFCILIVNTNYANAAKDTKKPTITLTVKNTEPTNKSVKVTFKATDASGIKTVKWAEGDQKTSYFSKKGTTVKLSKSTCSVTLKKNGVYTFYALDKAGNTKIKKLEITNIDKTVPTVSLKSTIMNQAATIKVTSKDASGIAKVQYVKGKVTDVTSEKWSTKATEVSNKKSFTVKKNGTYSVMVTDVAGNAKIKTIAVDLEMKAMWISYLEFKSTGYKESEFQALIDEMFDNCVELKMNTVVVQVRPFGDAMYPSKYFPWSKYISGKQGKDPGFDPLEYMVHAAHDRGLEFHAWINPYRVTLESGDYSALAEDNYARKWYEDEDTTNDRNILEFDTNSDKVPNIYYNPASSAVQKLIVNGVKEIVTNYDVDGIHFDDYFYPNLGSKYKKTFDNVEYNAYVEKCITNDKTPNAIEVWRRNNVNSLVKKVYAAIKDVNESVKFGISPAGNINNLYLTTGNYVDVKTWMASDKYIDYICPQLYWSFENKTVPFDKNLDNWLSFRTSSTVSMYVGIPTYRAGSNLEPEWEECDDVLQRMVEYSRSTGKVDGYFFFRYNYFFTKTTQAEVENLLSVLD